MILQTLTTTTNFHMVYHASPPLIKPFIMPKLGLKYSVIGTVAPPIQYQPAPVPLNPKEEFTYADFLKEVNEQKVDRIKIIKGNEFKVYTKEGDVQDISIPEKYIIALIDKLVENDVQIIYEKDSLGEFGMYSLMVLQYATFVGLAFIIFRSLFGGQRGPSNSNPNNPFGFTQSGAALYDENNENRVIFSDVAGLENAKVELQEIVDFLKTPEKYSVMGAKIPKGCLLTGAPGCGKTLLARAIAGEANVPFFSCSASEFVQLFVGVGASRVRSLFEEAAKKAPCIIFIDEIDAIGKTRSGSSTPSGGNDEREQTINQLLTEMDGFKPNNGVVVIGATNRSDVLDPALLRPGRFDRQITIELPDFKSRIAILGVHTKNKPLANDINLESIAKVTAGYSGADLSNLTNEAAILAVRRGKEKVEQADLEEAIEKVVLGPESSSLRSEEKKRLVSVHECGHALVALKVRDYDTVRKVTIIPRGRAGGVTLFQPDPERLDSGLYTRAYLLNQLAVALGGRAAEEIVYGYQGVTTGASSDVQKVQQLARMMVTQYGLGDNIGPVAWASSSKFDNNYSENISAAIDEEIQQIVKTAYITALGILNSNRATLDKMTEILLEKETLTQEDLEMLVN